MRIIVRAGHTETAGGATALLNELTEDRKVKDSVVKYLRALGHEVLDVTPPANTNLTIKGDLVYGVDKANKWGGDLFVSIHFNKAYASYNGAIGTEVCVYSKNDVAQRVVDAISGLGFKNRGQKVRNNLYELNSTKMKSMIVEVCFVEATEDVALYRKLGADTIGKTIAEAIVGTKVQAVSVSDNVEPSKEFVVRITADVLNVRKEPNTSSSVVTTVKKGDAYTIVSSSGSWLKLKSGKGWIHSSYTQKV